MILDHRRRKRLLIGIPPLLRDLAGLDLEHVADGGLLHEILALRSDTKRGVYAGLLSDGLRHGRCAEKQEGKTLDLDTSSCIPSQDWNWSFQRAMPGFVPRMPRPSRRRSWRILGHAASDALLFTPLRSATVLSLVLAAFSSLRLVVRKRTISSWPSSSAHAISVP